MNSENIKNITNQAIEQLIETLKAGKSEALTNYLAAVAKFHHYSFQNILLIARQCPQATRVAGFHAWRSLDRFVRKGEKGLMILAPLVRKVESADACSTEKESRIFGFRAVYVFDVSQTDGAPLPTIGVAQGEPGEYFSRLERLVRGQGITLEYSAEIGPAKGMSCGKKIILLPGMAPAEQFSTLVHELAHEMLHRDARRSQTTQCVRETEAEAVAFVRRIHNYLSDDPFQFEKCAVELVQMLDPNFVSCELTRPWRDGGRDAVGEYRVGTTADPLEVEFALEAKCYAPQSSVGVKEISRLISRLKYRQFGVLVTTSYLHEQAYKEIKEDRHPVLVLAAADLVNLLASKGYATPRSVEDWLNRRFPKSARK
jgi:hypothetical protein